MRFVLVLLTLCSVQVWGAEDQDIQSLLNEANSALQTQPAAKAKEKTKPTTRRQRHREEENLDAGSDDDSETASQKKTSTSPLPNTRLVPLNSPDLNAILSVDLSEKKREQTNIYPKSVVRVTGGLTWLGNGYSLVQDDDTFSNIGGGALSGLYVQYNPSWLLPFFQGSNTSTSLTLAFGAGYFKGQALMRRTGVQTGDQNYGLSTFPVDVEIGPVLSLWRRVGIQLAYGVGAEFVHQSGEGQWDTVTNMFWGDTASITFRGYLSESLEAYVGWKYRGLVLGSAPLVHANMITAGIGFEFAD